MNPAARLTWENLESFLLGIYRLKHNEVWLRSKGMIPEAIVARTVKEIRDGSLGPPRAEEFTGPMTFLRAVGQSERPFVYTGGWWFPEQQLLDLQRKFSRIVFGKDRIEVIRVALREVAAVSVDWANPMTELWSLRLPPGEKLTGLVSLARPQPVRQGNPDGPKLVGHATQTFLPVKNPLWISLYARLS